MITAQPGNGRVEVGKRTERATVLYSLEINRVNPG
jgi:hypothetical protein